MRRSRQKLVEALRRTALGDAAAFATIYTATSSKLYGIIVRILGRGALADKVLQKVFVRVWQRAGEFDPLISSPTTWLATIARNQALDEAKGTTMRSLEELPDLLHVPSDDNALGVQERNEELDRLRMCMGRLDREKREMVLLVYHHGLTREEIARRNGWPVATVKPWLRSGLAQLKDCLG
jgi:RNA polymerase sigma-70 factor (ECF subfamily)